MKYYIPRFKLGKMKALVNRLSKKTKVEFSYDENDIRQSRVLIANGVYAYYEEIGIELEINYKVGDYEIVAELEHQDEGNIIRKINTALEVPSKYRTCSPWCEHCKTNRYRKNTFLLVDKSGDYKQVGSNCLNDFIGYDSLKLAEMCSDLSVLLNSSVEEDEEFMLDLGSQDWDWLKSMANKFYQILLNRGYDRENPFMGIDTINYIKEYDAEVQKLLDVINTDWYEEGNDYCHNIKVILSMESIERKHWKMLMSYLYSAMKYLQSKENNNSQWLGEVKQRITFKVKQVKVLWSNYNVWASTYMNDVYDYTYRIITGDDNVVIWTTDKKISVDMEIKATIKSLDTYKDEKQTVVTRGSVING